MNDRWIIYEIMCKVFPFDKDGPKSRVAIVILIINELSK